MDRNEAKGAAALTALFLLAAAASAQDISETVGGLNNLLYGVAAGIAALMITFHAIKWKTADGAIERDAAKRGILNVILGLILIIIAAALVEMVYKKPEVGSGLQGLVR
jgi:tetrahydromethanopterin S-methyltransferase subunit G